MLASCSGCSMVAGLQRADQFLKKKKGKTRKEN
jgi:hypothetical protein